MLEQITIFPDFSIEIFLNLAMLHAISHTCKHRLNNCMINNSIFEKNVFCFEQILYKNILILKKSYKQNT